MVVLAVVLVAPSVAGAVLILGPTNPYNTPTANELPIWNLYQRVYPLSEIDQVASYLDAHTSGNISVFTADSIFAAAANRLVLLNLSTVIDDYVYAATPLGMNQSPLGPNNFGLAPTLSEIFATWNRTYVPYVIIGVRTVGWESVAPYLSRYLDERYHPVAVFDPGISTQIVVVEGLGPSPNAAQSAGSFPASPAPSTFVVDPGAALAFEGSEASSTIEAINSSGSRTPVSLPNGDVGVEALALSPSGTRLVAALVPGSLLVYSLTSSGSATFIDVIPTPGTVSELAFGGNSTTVYGLVPSQSSIIAVDLAKDSVQSLVSTDPSPIAFAVGVTEKRIAVSAAASANVAVYNLLSGKLIRHYGTGAVVSDHLVFNGNDLVGTQASPAVAYWLNLTSGVRDPETDLTGVASGFAVAGDLLFAGDVESGSVTVFNVTNGDPAGALASGVCPQILGFDALSNTLWATGGCSLTGAVLAVSAPERFPLFSPAGVAVSVDGFPSPAPAEEALFPGVHEVEAYAGGATTLTLVAVSPGGSHTVAVPSPIETWSTLQVTFSIAVGLGGLGAIVGLVGLAVWRPEAFVASTHLPRVARTGP